MAIDVPALNRNIRAEMVRAGLNQTSLAERITLSQSAFSRRLTGEADWTVGEISQLADALGVPLSALLPEVAA